MTKLDYYQILGVDRRATLNEIGEAYKKLARKYHPEINPADAAAREKFEQISEAYEVLSNSKRRAIYDRYGTYSEELETEAAKKAPADIIFEGFDLGVGEKSFGDVFEELLGIERAGLARKKEPQRGPDIEMPLSITFEQALTGFATTITIHRSQSCPRCLGKGETDEPLTSCFRCGGSGRRMVTRGPLRLSVKCEQCTGTGRSHPICPTCRSEMRISIVETLEVQIPAGVDTGSRIRVAEKGEAGFSGGPPGDLYIVTNVGKHPFFTRKGDNIYCTVPITLAEAILGAKIEVPTIRGKTMLRIPPGSQPGQVFRLHEQGVPSLRGDARGDQYVEVKVVTPMLVDQRSRELIREFDRLNPENPRAQLEKVTAIISEEKSGP